MKKDKTNKNLKGASIKTENLEFGYDSHSAALQEITLDIKAGERFGIIGRTGAGKSTLLLHLNGILSGKGSVEIGGLEVNRKNLPEIRRKVGLVFQNPDDQLFNPTVEEDVAFGPLNFGMSREEASFCVKEALDAFGLGGFEKLSSHHLSYGERKRVALATVMAMKPEVVALDEPFANLDPAMVQNIIKIVNDLPATAIIVSQAILPAFACCDRMCIMEDGKMIKTGTTEEIANDKELLQKSGLDYSFYYDICRSFHTKD